MRNVLLFMPHGFFFKIMTSSQSSSPQRSRSNNNNDQRPRFFDSKAKNRCWADAETVQGRHPERWRKDAAGNIVCKRFVNCYGCLCFEYDHIIPFSKGYSLSFLFLGSLLSGLIFIF